MCKANKIPKDCTLHLSLGTALWFTAPLASNPASRSMSLQLWLLLLVLLLLLLLLRSLMASSSMMLIVNAVANVPAAWKDETTSVTLMILLGAAPPSLCLPFP